MLHRVVDGIVARAPRIGVSDKTAMVSRTAAKANRSMLPEHSDEIAPDIGTAATIIETMLEALTHRAILTRRVHAQNDTLAKEVSRLIARYLDVNISPLCRCVELHRSAVSGQK